MAIDVEEYYRKYGPMVMRRCRFLLRDEDRALDATQDVFVRLLESREKLKDSYPSSLLYRIATNVCLNMMRSDRRSRTVSGENLLDMIASDERLDDRAAANDLLDRIFRREAPSTREIAVMHYVDGMTLEETAREAGLSVSGVRKRLRTLKARVEELEVSDYG
jgi:RNA polymerase sigma-70 factor (ECF subfamily)